MAELPLRKTYQAFGISTMTISLYLQKSKLMLCGRTAVSPRGESPTNSTSNSNLFPHLIPTNSYHYGLIPTKEPSYKRTAYLLANPSDLGLVRAVTNHSHAWNITLWLPVLMKSLQSVTTCLSIIVPLRLHNNVQHITCANVHSKVCFFIHDVLAISHHLAWSFNNSKACEHPESILNSIRFFSLSLLCQVLFCTTIVS